MTREREKILLVGVGELGGIVLEYLCRVPNIGPIVAADANADWGSRKTNSAIEGASYMGLYPQIEFRPIDVLNIEGTAELLRKINPTVICNGTTLQSLWVVNELPSEVNAKLYRDKC
jgi:saccharopine dehydrogenase-like NADP-dependent oxidoreductase